MAAPTTVCSLYSCYLSLDYREGGTERRSLPRVRHRTASQGTCRRDQSRVSTSGGAHRYRDLPLGDSGAVAATLIRVALLNGDQTLALLPVPRPSPCPGLLHIIQTLDSDVYRTKFDADRLDVTQTCTVTIAA